MAKARILVVEDENVVREYIKGTLETLGYGIAGTAATGEDAITETEKTRPELVLMDIRLKGYVDGIDATRQINARLDIPVVYLTSYADEDTLQRAKETKPFGYLMKPFDEKELNATIEIALYKHGEERQARERLLQELQQTTQRISGLAKELTEQGIAMEPRTPAPDMLKGAEQTFTLKEAAEYLEISERTIQRMMPDGLFPEPSMEIDIGGDRKLRRWKQADLDAVKPHLRQRGRPKGS